MDKSDTLKVSGALRFITALLYVVPPNNKRWYRINKLLVDSRPHGPSIQPGSEMSPQSSEEKTQFVTTTPECHEISAAAALCDL